MFKLFNGLLNGLGVADEEDLDDYDEGATSKKKNAGRVVEDEDIFDEPAPTRKDPLRSNNTIRSQKLSDEDDFSDYDYRRDRQTKPSPVKVVPLRSQSLSNRSLEVSITKPKRFEDSQDICDMLKNECATVVNLEGIDLAMAQRIMDFVSGAVYSLNGKIHQVSNLIFIVSPDNVDISGDFLSYVEQDSFEVPTLNQMK